MAKGTATSKPRPPPSITLVFYLLTVIAFWITRNQMAQQVAA
nr:hypothetical protein [Escherichia coli]